MNPRNKRTWPKKTAIRVDRWPNGNRTLVFFSSNIQGSAWEGTVPQVPASYDTEIILLLAAAGREQCTADELNDIDNVVAIEGIGRIELYHDEGPLIELTYKKPKEKQDGHD